MEQLKYKRLQIRFRLVSRKSEVVVCQLQGKADPLLKAISLNSQRNQEQLNVQTIELSA